MLATNTRIQLQIIVVLEILARLPLADLRDLRASKRKSRGQRQKDWLVSSAAVPRADRAVEGLEGSTTGISPGKRKKTGLKRDKDGRRKGRTDDANTGVQTHDGLGQEGPSRVSGEYGTNSVDTTKEAAMMEERQRRKSKTDDETTYKRVSVLLDSLTDSLAIHQAVGGLDVDLELGLGLESGSAKTTSAGGSRLKGSGGATARDEAQQDRFVKWWQNIVEKRWVWTLPRSLAPSDPSGPLFCFSRLPHSGSCLPLRA